MEHNDKKLTVCCLSSLNFDFHIDIFRGKCSYRASITTSLVDMDPRRQKADGVKFGKRLYLE